MGCNCGGRSAPKTAANARGGYLWQSADGQQKLVLPSAIEAEAKKQRNPGSTVQPVQK